MERLKLTGPAGALEALLEWDPVWQPRFASLVCHPHPLYGGTMHNKVAYYAAKAALAVMAPTLRFNFRGAGQSQGTYAGGVGEMDDARAALDSLADRFPNLPLVAIGFSFGSTIALSVGAADQRVRALVGIGLPVGSTDFQFLKKCLKPKLIVQAGEDRYGPREKLQALFDRLQDPKELRWIRGVDHFFAGKLPELQSAVESFLRIWAASVK